MLGRRGMSLRYCYATLKDGKPNRYYDGRSFHQDLSRGAIYTSPKSISTMALGKYRGEKIVCLIFSSELKEELNAL